MRVPQPTPLFRLRERLFVAKHRRRLARLAAYCRPPADAAALLAALRAKTLVFSVTAGRTGTTYVARLLALCPDTTSLHEPEPSFVRVMRLAQLDASWARRFLLEYKLPFIAARPSRRYVETGHLLCKGFLEAMLELGLVPHIIGLRRAPRRIATSLLSRHTVPGRSKLGLKYLLHPLDPGVLPLPDWTCCSDYQLCFWYALEIERRQRAYRPLIDRAGGRWVDITAEELHEPPRFLAAAEALGLLDADTDLTALLAAHGDMSGRTFNPNQTAATVRDPEAEEEALWRAVAAPDLRAAVEARYGAGS
jgi:hypothetical protein